MRILFILEHFHPYLGGNETLFRNLTTALAAKGHEVTVLTTKFRPDLPADEHFERVRIRRVSSWNRYIFTFMSFPVAWRLARHADVVHTASYNAAPAAWLAARLTGKPVVITFHEVWGVLWFRLPFISPVSRRLNHWFEKLILKLPFTRFIAVSGSTRRRLVQAGVPAAKVDVVYNGLDYSRLHRIKGTGADPAGSVTQTRGFRYCYFGRLGASKGLEILLAAAAEFSHEAPGSRLVLIIPTYPRGLYRVIMNGIRRLGLSTHLEIHHLLPFEDLLRVLASVDCVVIPSYSEGFCYSAAEACALGIPVVSSDRMALRETVGGKCIRMRSLDKAGLLEALRQALRNEWEVLPDKRFPLDDTVAGYEAVYESLVGS